MDWNCNLRPPFVSRPDNSLSFFYNYNYDPYQEMKHSMQTTQTMVPQMLDKNNYGNQEKKKRLTSEQLESLESSFQEEIKLDPDRKMKLAKDLGMQPRQIAVWFQNRRARWKAKQLERLYEGVKQELEVVSMEKQKLQEEVMALRSMIKEQGGKKPVSTGYTEMSGGEETVESTSMPRSHNPGAPKSNNQQMPECSYVFNVEDYNPAMPPAYWGGLPTYQ